MVGNGPLPCAGSVTSTSSGTPSNVGTPSTVLPGAPSVVGQNRVPSPWLVQRWPNGAGGWAATAELASGRPASTPATNSEPSTPLHLLQHIPMLAVCPPGPGSCARHRP